MDRGLSQRRACALLKVPRSTLKFESAMPAQGRAGDRGDETAVSRVSTLWLPPHSDFPEPRRALDEPGVLLPAAAPGGPAGAEQAATPTHCQRQTASEGSAGGPITNRRPAEQMPDRHR